MTDYLHEKTALLPRIKIAEPKSVIGKNTEQAMLSGAVFGYRGLITELLAQLKGVGHTETPGRGDRRLRRVDGRKDAGHQCRRAAAHGGGDAVGRSGAPSGVVADLNSIDSATRSFGFSNFRARSNASRPSSAFPKALYITPRLCHASPKL